MTRDWAQWGARASIAGAAAFVLVVATLHGLQPSYDPASQLMSELALGPHGWAMLPAFAGLAVSAAGICVALAGRRASKLLTGLLWAASALFLLSGLFPLGETSTIHIAAIASAFIVSVLAIYLFPSLGADAAPIASRPFSWSCAAGIAMSVGLGHSVLPMGIGQRMAAGFLLLWFVMVAWRLLRRAPRTA